MYAPWNQAHASDEPRSRLQHQRSLITFVHDPVVIANPDLANRYGGLPSLPALLIDRNGKIAESHAGMMEKDAFESKIKALVHEDLRRTPVSR